MKEKILEKLKIYNQQHIIDHYTGITGDEQNRLLNLLGSFDMDLIFRIYRNFLQKETKKEGLRILPANIVPLPNTPQEEAIREKARDLGEKLIKNNKVAVLIVAGGQGTRLGYDGP
ncbi:MAG: UTP--glucose-1-phosphate uridylyltransferase, partial [Syntrophorhabdaceae bacterium]|nr:UTP--glucose-1-phosphate uridylyltransferase [Syntrophorhabdaceae bacterium]